jgi:hypothetical protein
MAFSAGATAEAEAGAEAPRGEETAPEAESAATEAETAPKWRLSRRPNRPQKGAMAVVRSEAVLVG